MDSSGHTWIVLLPLLAATLLLAVGVTIGMFVARRTRREASHSQPRANRAVFVVPLVIGGLVAVFLLGLLVFWRASPELGIVQDMNTYHDTNIYPEPPAELAAITEGSTVSTAEARAATFDEAERVFSSVVGEANPMESDEADSKLPDWAAEKRVEGGGQTLVVIDSQQYSTVEEADQTALAMAVQKVTEYVHHDDFFLKTKWTAPVGLVKDHAIRQRYVETIERDFGTITAPMHRVHLQVELSDDVAADFLSSRRTAVVNHRLWALGGTFGAVSLLLAAVFACLRLDASTGGAYRKRLGVAAVSLIAAVVVAAMVLS